MRKSGSTSAAIVANLKKGTAVTVYSESNGWAKVKANGKDGYVSTKYLSASKSGSKATQASVAKPAATAKTTTKYVNVSSGSLNMRKSGSTSAAIVLSLKKGTAVTVYSESNGWAKVKANGKDGYVSTKYLTAAKPGTTTKPAATKPAEVKTTTKYVNVSSGSLNMRKSGSARAAIVASLKKGTAVTVYSESNGWAKVKANGKDGYVSTKYLSASKPGTTTKPAATKPAEVKTTTKYVNVSSGSLNMRKSGSARAAIVASLKKGTAVTVYSESNGWAKVKADGKDGYVSTKYLSASKPGTTTAPAATKPAEVKTTTKYVNVNSGSLNVRKSAAGSAAIVTTLSKGTAVTVYSESNGWAKITANGKEGYVSTAYLSTTKPGTTTKPAAPKPAEEKTVTKYVNVSSGKLNLRNKPSNSGSIITGLAKGVEVQVLSESDGWSHVKVYNGEGYVSSAYLSDTNPAVSIPETSGSDSAPAAEQESATVMKFVKVSDGSSLNMRSEPSASSSIVTKLANQTAVTVYSEENGWARVTANGKSGYVSTSYLTSAEPAGIKVTKDYTNYNLTLDQMVNYQVAANAQTDTYKAYIREDALNLISSTKGTVDGSGWRLRSDAGTNYSLIGTVSNNQTLTIKSKKLGSDGYYWYEVAYNKQWVNASPEDVKYYVDANNFVNDPVKSFQFLNLSKSTTLNVADVNSRILAGKGILAGKASSFKAAGDQFGINEIYLISHALLETGNGKSELANGVQINGKTVYNMYGIGAYDSSAVSSGAQYAYNAGWFTPEAAIIGGAEFIAKGYISKGQDTLYKMRWNPEGAANNKQATHQYATDIGWASKQVNQVYNLYSLLDSYELMLDIPVYK